jgi:hypothetical protein
MLSVKLIDTAPFGVPISTDSPAAAVGSLKVNVV